MGEKPSQDQKEMFPKIAEESAKDIVTKRREKHQKISDILKGRDLSREIEIKISMREKKEREEKIRKILEDKK